MLVAVGSKNRWVGMVITEWNLIGLDRFALLGLFYCSSGSNHVYVYIQVIRVSP